MPSRDSTAREAQARFAQPLRLRAGPLTLQFDPNTASLRRLCLGGTELVRGVYAAVRDRDWGTVPSRLEDLKVRHDADSFRLDLNVNCRAADIHFVWQGTLAGFPDGTISFTFEGEARSSFLSNRIGFCVLHPLAGCVGRACTVEHTDDRVEQGLFPRWVAPHQPFQQIRALTTEPLPGLRVSVAFEGDVFEMEDQRNWTDASFKTYCRPLALPFPVPVEPGQRFRQTVTIRTALPAADGPARPDPGEPSPTDTMRQGPPEDSNLLRSRRPKEGQTLEICSGVAAGSQSLLTSAATSQAGCKVETHDLRPPETVELKVPEEPTFALPPLGLGLASHGQPLSRRELQRLQLLGLSHLRADLSLAKPDWRETLRRATDDAAHIGCSLHLALFLTERAEAEVQSIAAEVMQSAVPVSLWLVFPADAQAASAGWLQRVKTALARWSPGVPVAAGTNANFAELNRHRPAPDSGLLPCFSLNPQVHAFDDASLVENLEAQAQVVESASQFSPHSVVISPITLKPRFNAVATAAAPLAPGELPPAVDTRQNHLFAAAWTLASIAALSATGRVHSLTYYETTGWRGVMETETGSPLPEKFPSVAGSVFPIFHVLAGLAGFRHGAPIPVAPALTLTALALFGPDRRRVLLANLTNLPQTVRLRAARSPRAVRLLDSTNLNIALREPRLFLTEPGGKGSGRTGVVELRLRPHAVACLDWEPRRDG